MHIHFHYFVSTHSSSLLISTQEMFLGKKIQIACERKLKRHRTAWGRKGNYSNCPVVDNLWSCRELENFSFFSSSQTWSKCFRNFLLSSFVFEKIHCGLFFTLNFYYYFLLFMRKKRDKFHSLLLAHKFYLVVNYFSVLELMKKKHRLDSVASSIINSSKIIEINSKIDKLMPEISKILIKLPKHH